jgi:alkyldihydroxyacetonephosphate synthase
VTDLRPSPGTVTPPIALEGGGEPSGHLLAEPVPVDAGFLGRLADVCASVQTSDPAVLAEAGRDWWPLAMTWALEGDVPGLPSAVARPADAAEVAAVVALCNEARVPLTAAGGRSGVSGASVPVHGGVVLDTTAMSGITAVDPVSGTVDVLPGTFGDVLEEELRATHGLTLGHWPQSIALSTVGGWLACRSAGQLSTRYGKIEDMVVALDVVLADGTTVSTGGAPRAAAGPDLNQVFVGSEGTLGVITSARLRCHPAPAATRKAAYAFPSFVAGIDGLRTILRRGATPAVARLYDPIEADRSWSTGDQAVLLVLDEGDPVLVDATMAVVAESCATAAPMDDGLVDRWLGHRNDVSALEALTRKGFVVDTMEIAGPWSRLPGLYEAVLAALQGIDGMKAASAHQSHSYLDGGCLYFSFAGRPPLDERESFYVRAWDAATAAVLAGGGALSHHHGVGLNRSRFMAQALGAGMEVLQSLKTALDPNGILNPGKLGLTSPFGAGAWPST